jgi:hypothetical protein
VGVRARDSQCKRKVQCSFIKSRAANKKKSRRFEECPQTKPQINITERERAGARARERERGKNRESSTSLEHRANAYRLISCCLLQGLIHS